MKLERSNQDKIVKGRMKLCSCEVRGYSLDKWVRNYCGKKDKLKGTMRIETGDGQEAVKDQAIDEVLIKLGGTGRS